MHTYATNSPERKTVIVAITVASILLAYGLNSVLTWLRVSVPWWLDTPSVVGFFGLLYGCFDRWLWKWPPMHRIGLVKVPNLNGEWHGHLHTSHDQFELDRDVTVRIAQTWTDLCIQLETDHSRSESVVAAILLQARRPALTYQYRNEPHTQATDSMHAHKGTVWLDFEEHNVKDVLAGDYYSGRDRQNTGTLKLERLH